jgi:hypothetical protein
MSFHHGGKGTKVFAATGTQPLVHCSLSNKHHAKLELDNELRMKTLRLTQEQAHVEFSKSLTGGKCKIKITVFVYIHSIVLNTQP